MYMVNGKVVSSLQPNYESAVFKALADSGLVNPKEKIIALYEDDSHINRMIRASLETMGIINKEDVYNV